MADIGQDAESLRIKVLETEVTMEEKEFAKKRIALEKLRLAARSRELDRSIEAIDEQIRGHKKDRDSLEAAFQAANSTPK
jgi:hypothetical protein